MIDMRDPDTWRHLPRHSNPDKPACLIANKVLAEIESGQIDSATREDLVVLVHWLVPRIAELEWLSNKTPRPRADELTMAKLEGAMIVREDEQSVRMHNATQRQEKRQRKNEVMVAKLREFVFAEYKNSEFKKWPSAKICVKHLEACEVMPSSQSLVTKCLPSIKRSILESIAKK